MVKRDKKGFLERLSEIADELKMLAEEDSGDHSDTAKDYEKAAATVEGAANQVGGVLFADWS